MTIKDFESMTEWDWECYETDVMETENPFFILQVSKTDGDQKIKHNYEYLVKRYNLDGSIVTCDIHLMAKIQSAYAKIGGKNYLDVITCKAPKAPSSVITTNSSDLPVIVDIFFEYPLTTITVYTIVGVICLYLLVVYLYLRICSIVTHAIMMISQTNEN